MTNMTLDMGDLSEGNMGSFLSSPNERETLPKPDLTDD
jgi:hypothetical protein